MNSDNQQPQTDCSWVVSGMDCGSCAVKIRTAVEQLPGLSNVKISTMNETLSVTLDEKQTARDVVESQVKRLGYELRQADRKRTNRTAGRGEYDPKDITANITVQDLDPASHAARWYHTAKGKLVLITGLVLLAAWIAKLIFTPQVSILAFTAAALIGVAPVARRAFAALMARIPFTIEMLMTIAVGGAILIGAVEEAALVVFLFAVGEALEGLAADQARASIKGLANLVPKTAKREQNGSIVTVDAATLKIGQTIIIGPGDRIPADGVIIDGTSSIDESPITGEAIPITKTVNDPVYAGSINAEARLRVRVEKESEDNTIARIIQLVEEANDARAPTERFIERFSRYYMPAIVGMSALVAVVPPLLFDAEWSTWIYRGLALLLIGCPCALVISVPAAMASALSAGARQGLLIKGGSVIEAIAATKVIAFDKTGTLTVGRPVVTNVLAFSGDKKEVLSLSAALESGSTHPLGQAIAEYSSQESVSIPKVKDLRAIPGRGVVARLDGVDLFIGSPRYSAERIALPGNVKAAIAELENAGKTVALLAKGERAIGLIALLDEARSDAIISIRQLTNMAIRTIMLTGDNKRAAKAIAGRLKLDYRAEMLPEDKVSVVREMSSNDGLMMIGDGINDAPALASADVGIAMGAGTDVALETADAALLRNRLADVVNLIDLSRATMSNIHQNISIALGLKAILLLTSIIGVTGLWMAIMADTGATVLVTLNAMRLLGFKSKMQQSSIN